MKAAYVDRLGPVSEIRYGDLPDPEPGPGQVVVRVRAISMNRVDTLVRSGDYRTPLSFPLALGRDLVGVVQALGADVDGPAVGSPVWTNSAGYGGRPGASAELVPVDADRLYHVPEGVDPLEFVASFHPGATAHGLAERVGLDVGDRLAVAGANGSVGACLVQVAHQRGARVAAVVRRDRSAYALRALGADEVVIAEGADAPAAAAEALGGLDVLVDPTGRWPIDACAQAMEPRGRIVLVTGREPFTADRWAFYVRELQLVGFVMSGMDVDELARAAARMNERPLAVPVGEVLDFDQVARAQQRVADGELPRITDGPFAGMVGRLVLVPSGAGRPG